jgi:hypothetical protein
MTPQPWYFSVFGVFFQARARIFGEGAKAPEAEAWLPRLSEPSRIAAEGPTYPTVC